MPFIVKLRLIFQLLSVTLRPPIALVPAVPHSSMRLIESLRCMPRSMPRLSCIVSMTFFGSLDGVAIVDGACLCPPPRPPCCGAAAYVVSTASARNATIADALLLIHASCSRNDSSDDRSIGVGTDELSPKPGGFARVGGYTRVHARNENRHPAALVRPALVPGHRRHRRGGPARVLLSRPGRRNEAARRRLHQAHTDDDC